MHLADCRSSTSDGIKEVIKPVSADYKDLAPESK
jgi:hypothetical protein